MYKVISFIGVWVFLAFWTLEVFAGIGGVYVSGKIYSYNRETVTLHQKEQGFAVTIPRSLVKDKKLKVGEQVTFLLDSTEGVKSKPLRKKASTTSKKKIK